MTAELNIHLEVPVCTKTVSTLSFTNPTSTVALQLLNLWLLKVMFRCVNDDVTTINPGNQITGNAWYGQMSRPPRSSLHQEKFTFGERPKKAKIRNAWFQETHGRGPVMVWAAISCYFRGPITILHGRITSSDYVDILGNQIQPMIQTLFPNNHVVFKDDNAPIHTVGTVQSWFEEHEGELQHLFWPSQSPDFNITESLFSVLKTAVRKRLPPTTSLKATWRCSSRTV